MSESTAQIKNPKPGTVKYTLEVGSNGDRTVTASSDTAEGLVAALEKVSLIHKASKCSCCGGTDVTLLSSQVPRNDGTSFAAYRVVCRNPKCGASLVLGTSKNEAASLYIVVSDKYTGDWTLPPKRESESVKPAPPQSTPRSAAPPAASKAPTTPPPPPAPASFSPVQPDADDSDWDGDVPF